MDISTTNQLRKPHSLILWWFKSATETHF